MAVERVVIGTRSSALALWQSNFVRTHLSSHHPNLRIDLETIKTLGDKILDSPLSKIGDKGLFTKEIEKALLDRRIDLAVHSLKDIPTEIPKGLQLAVITEREDVHDVFLSHPSKAYKKLADVPANGTIATGSLRRKCQLLKFRPDFQIVDIRGNLNTRLQKLEESDWDGLVLARAGVRRLGWTDRITEVLPFEIMLPAVGQGALAVEIRSGDLPLKNLLQTLHHDSTATAVLGERALLRYLEGGCQIPIGAYGRIEGNQFVLEALIGSLDGRTIVRGTIKGRTDKPESLGTELARQLLDRGGKEILEGIRGGANGIDV